MLSLVLLSYSANDHLKDLARKALKSYENQADEVIIIEDGGMFDPEQRDLSDIYVYNKENRGFTHSVNQGIKIAHGDYIALVNNDTYLKGGKLKDLCIKDTVASPRVENQKGFEFAGSFFVLPKTVIEKIGLMDESMKIYYSDTEYLDRINKNKIPTKMINSVVIHHYICQSVPYTKVSYGKDKENYENTLR